jgi:hypothetical protein
MADGNIHAVAAKPANTLYTRENLARTAGLLVGLTALAIGILTLTAQVTGKLNGLTSVYDGNKAVAYSVGGVVAAIGVTAVTLAVFGFKPAKAVELVAAGAANAAEGAEKAKAAAKKADKKTEAIIALNDDQILALQLAQIREDYCPDEREEVAVEPQTTLPAPAVVLANPGYNAAPKVKLTAKERAELAREKEETVFEAVEAELVEEGKIDVETLERELRALENVELPKLLKEPAIIQKKLSKTIKPSSKKRHKERLQKIPNEVAKINDRIAKIKKLIAEAKKA